MSGPLRVLVQHADLAQALPRDDSDGTHARMPTVAAPPTGRESSTALRELLSATPADRWGSTLRRGTRASTFST